MVGKLDRVVMVAEKDAPNQAFHSAHNQIVGLVKEGRPIERAR